MLKHILKKIFSKYRNKEFILFPYIKNDIDLSDIIYKVSFMLPECKLYYSGIDIGRVKKPEYLGNIELSNKIYKIKYLRLLLLLFTFKNILIWDTGSAYNLFLRILLIFPNVFNIDRKQNQKEGWEYFNAYNYSLSDNEHNSIRIGIKRTEEYLENIQKKEKCFIFGSGKSLENAYNYSFENHYKIVCNSMIKNLGLMEYIKPDILVLADAIYHFGPSIYAKKIQESLKIFLIKHSNCILFIPHLFYHHLMTNMKEFEYRIYPVSFCSGQTINLNLKNRCCLHKFENVLNILMLPLASTLSANIFLLGFDGRKSGDNKFWSYSKDNNFNEFLDDQEKAHPGFFKDRNYEQFIDYTASQTEEILKYGESVGKKYYSLSESNNPALKIRYKEIK